MTSRRARPCLRTDLLTNTALRQPGQMLRRRDQKPTQHSGNPDWCCAGPVPRDSPTVGRPPLPCTHASAAGVVTKGARASLCTSPGPLQHRETNRDGDHRLALRPRLVIAPLTCEHSSHQTGGRRPIPVPSAKVTRGFRRPGHSPPEIKTIISNVGYCNVFCNGFAIPCEHFC